MQVNQVNPSGIVQLASVMGVSEDSFREQVGIKKDGYNPGQKQMKL